MVRLAHLITGSNAVAEEIVQDAFIRLHEHWERADNHHAYLRTIVTNLCKTQLRRQDLEEAEIARILGCRPGTVKSTIHRGLTRLRKEMR
jgi:DNA-directed RNA polymerase specialized sigma24 family protein